MTSGGTPLRRVGGYCLRHRRHLFVATAGALTATVMSLLIPLVQRRIIDGSIVTHRDPVGPYVLVLVVAALLTFAGSYLLNYVSGRLAMDVQHDLRVEMFASLSRLDGTRQDELDRGQVVARAISDIRNIIAGLIWVPTMLGNVVLFVFSLVIMAVLSPLLTLVALLTGPLLLVIALASRRRLFPASWEAQERAADVASVLDGAVTGVRVVKGFGQEEQELDRFERASERMYAARVRTVRLTARYDPALRAVPLFGQIGVLALGGWLAIHGAITLGTFLAFSLYLLQMVAPVRFLAGQITLVQQAAASAVRAFEVIDSRPVVADRPGAVTLPDGPAEVEFDGVRFGYDPAHPVLDGLTLRVAPGETVAIAGTTGSGKSTIAMLLPRFYDVQAGAVRVNGHDVRDLTRDSLRAAIGPVLEDAFLFSDTVRANIAFGRSGATDDEVVAAARAAEADGFIRALPHGYDTVVAEEGLTLSGGQRQRIALARALLADPRILILDDVTSAVDPGVEAMINATLRRVLDGRTTLLIAHRRSTLRLADRIVVLDEGRVVDEGTHEELSARCPLYARLLSGPGDGEADGEAPEPPARATPDLWDADRRPDAAPEEPPPRNRPAIDRDAARAPEPEFRLRRLLRPVLGALVAALVLDCLDVAAGLALPILTRDGIDRGVLTSGYHTLFVLSAAGVAIVAADWAVNVAGTSLVGRNGERLVHTLRVKVFAHLQRLGLNYYESEASGRISTLMTTYIDALSVFLRTGLIGMVNSLLSFFGILAGLLVLDPRLGLLVLTVMPALAVVTLLYRARSGRAYQDSGEKTADVNADLQENVAGLRVTQAYRREDQRKARFARRSDAYRVARLRAQRYSALYFPFVQLMPTVSGALVLLVAAGQVRDGSLSAGALIAYLLYIEMLFWPVQQLSEVLDGYQQAKVGVREVGGFLRVPVSPPSPERPVAVGRLRGRIELRGVRFRYGPDLPESIRGVDLTVEPGETVALVGRTGAGKSTLVKLVARFYDVTEGAVLADGVDVRAFDVAGYRRRLGIVPQEPHLVAGTVRDTIAYGRPGADDASVEAAARAVGAHEMIARLPGGYLHPVGQRGRTLSAGQRQLLALARARLVDPDILLLDEATAALDLASEAAVTRAMAELATRRTTLLVAHRLTTAARADRIVVLDEGRIAETGTHDELTAAGGLYAALWSAYTDQAAPMPMAPGTP
jgi:ATP-binding cassette subfamily B protein